MHTAAWNFTATTEQSQQELTIVSFKTLNLFKSSIIIYQVKTSTIYFVRFIALYQLR